MFSIVVFPIFQHQYPLFFAKFFNIISLLSFKIYEKKILFIFPKAKFFNFTFNSISVSALGSLASLKLENNLTFRRKFLRNLFKHMRAY